MLRLRISDLVAYQMDQKFQNPGIIDKIMCSQKIHNSAYAFPNVMRSFPNTQHSFLHESMHTESSQPLLSVVCKRLGESGLVCN